MAIRNMSRCRGKAKTVTSLFILPALLGEVAVVTIVVKE